MFSRFFIYRPKFALVISIVITIAGILGYVSLPVEQFPNITPPVVNVSATYTGANAEVLAITRSGSILERLSISSSAIPLASHCWSPSGLMSSKGRTTIDEIVLASGPPNRP